MSRSSTTSQRAKTPRTAPADEPIPFKPTTFVDVARVARPVPVHVTFFLPAPVRVYLEVPADGEEALRAAVQRIAPDAVRMALTLPEAERVRFLALVAGEACEERPRTLPMILRQMKRDARALDRAIAGLHAEGLIGGRDGECTPLEDLASTLETARAFVVRASTPADFPRVDFPRTLAGLRDRLVVGFAGAIGSLESEAA